MFENVEFKGNFRDYQQRVLDAADRYLNDGKIHIVAAPGSGKTILGLELIKRLDAPSIIFSPTTTIRNQWCERFNDNFVLAGNKDRYTSFDLTKLNLITSVTYQALYSAMKKQKDDNIDYSEFDLIKAIQDFGVKTICLDEAHHLQNEWQKALENFISILGDKIKIISLTATPPYDATPNEWKRYINVCGEIDEEIFVPELVKQKNLCPHQDYIYFNYPTKEETASFDEYRDNTDIALNELFKMKSFKISYEKIAAAADDHEFIYSDVKGLVSLLALYRYGGIDVDKRIIKKLTVNKNLPKLTAEYAEQAINFLINGDLLAEDGKKEILDIFKRYGLVEKGSVALNLSVKLKRRLVSSVGKLKSISTIVKSEYDNKKDGLRMLILTDFIKKESLSLIGTDKDFNEVSIVSVFETVRRTQIDVGAVSGSLVILPNRCSAHLKTIMFEMTRIKNTDYSVYEFKADNREKVKILGELFKQGLIKVLIGTKSLLGEGWDAPCVNTLILASFVGSFMLSNQMRGRAIRTDLDQPDKVANIWHLVTIERPYLYADKADQRISLRLDEDKSKLESYDFETVSRRFDCFVAPNYTTGEVSSGIERITAIRPPYDEKGIEAINREMLLRANDKTITAAAWDKISRQNTTLNHVSELKADKKIPPFTFLNIGKAAFFASLFVMALVEIIVTLTQKISLTTGWTLVLGIFGVMICAITGFNFISLLQSKILAHANPEKSMRALADCVLKTMQEKGLVAYGSKVKTNADKQGLTVQIELVNAYVHDQNVFHSAISELFSPIQNPRYLLIPTGLFGKQKLKYALACPEILGKRNEFVECLAKNLKNNLGKIKTVYTRSEEGRKLILKCRKASYLSYNNSLICNIRNHVSNWE